MGAPTLDLPSFLWPAASGVQSIRDPLNFKHFHNGLSSYWQKLLAELHPASVTAEHEQYSAPLV